MEKIGDSLLGVVEVERVRDGLVGVVEVEIVRDGEMEASSICIYSRTAEVCKSNLGSRQSIGRSY